MKPAGMRKGGGPGSRGGAFTGRFTKGGRPVYGRHTPHPEMLKLAQAGARIKPGSQEHEAHHNKLRDLALATYGPSRVRHGALARHHDRAYDTAKGEDKKAHAWLWMVHSGISWGE